MWDKKNSSQGKARQGNQAKKAKAKGKNSWYLQKKLNDVELERLLGFNVDQAHKLTIKCEEENVSLMEKVKNLKNKLDKPRYLKKFSK